MLNMAKTGWVDILFLVRIPSAFAIISMHYLLNQLMDFDQTCTDILFGGGKELIKFWGH